MKRIKKWQIIGLVVLGITGYWLTQNMWVFQRKIIVEDYATFFINKSWMSKDATIWTFSETELIRYSYENSKKIIWSTDLWAIDGKTLTIKETPTSTPFVWRIQYVTEDGFKMRLSSPSPNGIPASKKFKQYEE
jgi:hypothetical protein